MGRLARALRQRGAEVFTPTLTGLGEREHLATRDVGLNTHIQDVGSVLHYEDLRDVVLVGHSYGGAVVTGVADRTRDRIRRLIYFDAFVLRDGESMADVLGPDLIRALNELALSEGDGWRVPSPFSMEQFGVTNPGDVAWNERGLTLHPLKTLVEPLALQPEPLPFPVSYISCTEQRMGLLDQSAARARSEGWEYQELSSTHAAPAIAPDRCADLLLTIAVADAPVNRASSG
jgi:pimeloyl-ACP methyl ester carboxylesterase